MKLGIHASRGTFSDYWIKYCIKKSIPYKIVDCYNDKIIDHLSDCNVLMWHYSHNDYKDVLFAKQLMFALEQAGKKVFPNFNSAWHFDDKIGQKYLFEALKIPLVRSYVFYDKNSAIDWVKSTDFPKVFKLRGGAGSANVSLVKSKRNAIEKVNIAFGKGFSQFDGKGYLLDILKKYKDGILPLKNVIKAAGRLFISTAYAKMKGRERGYVYFQDYIPNNSYDIRVIVIGEKAFAIKRMVRKKDFRASGSGVILYEKNNFDEQTLSLAFDIATKVNSQCIALDFVYNCNHEPLLVEASYAFNSIGYLQCIGYWNKKLEFFNSIVNPHEWMIDYMINSLESSNL